ncbi:MAG: undecaprenyl-phosphate glucose phosphotransferase [Halobacteriovoraceae bacterium]|nr:undecaprenyl-phosphate glucose phosphotransferase [Halobacteriovoraceae bacterium]
MLKSHHREFEILHKVVDLLIVLLCWWASYLIRFETIVPQAQSGLELWYLKANALLLGLSYYYFRREGFYSSKRLESIFRELVTVARANTYAFIVFVLLIYFFTPHKASRIFLITYYVLSTSVLITFKLSMRKLLQNLRAKGKNIRYSLLVGSGKQVQDYVKKVLQHKEAGIAIKGWADSDGLADKLGIPSFDGFTPSLLENLTPDLVVIGYANKDSHKIDYISRSLLSSTTETLILPDLTYSLVGYSIVEFHGLPIIQVNEPNIKSRSMIFKRVFDIFLSALALIVLSPVFLVLSILVKRSSPGPIFYSQERMGLDGNRFKMWKFRSMKVGEENHGGWTVENDPRVTKIGRILRKTSLDEIPQFFNVLIGDMSLVGPRPERPKYVEQFKKEIPTYMLRHKMKAGITGWAQINGWRGDTSIEKRIECDLYYIRNWSVWLDVTILTMTLTKGIFSKNAY